MTRTKAELNGVKLEKKLAIIAGISFLLTMVAWLADSDESYPGVSGFFRTAFEIVLMTGLIFTIITINFFAISFFLRKIAGLFKK